MSPIRDRFLIVLDRMWVLLGMCPHLSSKKKGYRAGRRKQGILYPRRSLFFQIPSSHFQGFLPSKFDGFLLFSDALELSQV